MHEFVVVNDSADVRTLVKVKSTCGCTIAAPSRTVADPGEGMVIPVTVRPGKGLGRRTQAVTLSFGNGVPDRILTVAWTVQAPLSLIPDTYHIDLVPGQQERTKLTIENFSDSRWSDVACATRPAAQETPWIAIEEVRESPVVETGAHVPLQRWTASISVDSRQLKPGDYVEVVHVTARAQGRELRRQVLVNVSLSPAVRVIPQSLLIVDVGRGEEIAKPISFRFIDQARVPDLDRIRLTHDLPISLSLQCAEPKGSTVIGSLSVKSIPQAAGIIRGEAILEFGDPVNENITLSIAIVVRAPEGSTTPEERKQYE